MRKPWIMFLLLLAGKIALPQCTPANLQATAALNTPNYPLNTAFNTSTTSAGTITNLSNGIISFTGTVAGTATWSNGIRIMDDPTPDIGNYIYVQPNNTDNASSVNVATYTFTFSEPLYNISFRVAGLNNQDQLKVSAFNGASPITLTSANFTNLDAGITVSGGNVLTGTSTLGGTDVNSNRATITIAGPVTSIVMTSGKSDDNNSTVTIGFTSFAYTRCVNAPPDFNNTFVNTTVSGNVSINDVAPSGTQYGTATAQPGNPGPAVPTINSNGTYTFTSAVAGVFRFTVPMCPPGIVTPNCADVLLVITVTQPNTYNNNPVANIDRATTQVNTAVVLNTLANDKAGNNSPIALNPASVSVTVAPLHGTTSVNTTNGNITYTPNSNYTGFDTLTYRVCDATTPTPLCATSLQIITVQSASASNNTAAADDYNSTPFNTPVSGDVHINDNDPQNNTQTITSQNTSVPGVGTLVLNTNGSYTFTPANGFNGAVNFPYQTCDNGTPQACANATLYLLVYPTFTLPLDLISFNAVIVNNDVKLSWVSENQVNVSHFEIERSPDGFAGFTKLGQALVNNSLSGSYVFTDVNAKLFFTKGYYRLKIVDIDGKITYSKIVLVNFGNSIATDIRPTLVRAGNPVYILTATNSRSSYSGFLYTQSGQLLYTWKTATGGSTQIETSGLAAGTYFIKLLTNSETRIQKITVY
jgi:hypothetical protein